MADFVSEGRKCTHTGMQAYTSDFDIFPSENIRLSSYCITGAVAPQLYLKNRVINDDLERYNLCL